jgi:hypothetical protein
MCSHVANYTNLHECVNAYLYLTPQHADTDTQWMDCIDWLNAQIDKNGISQESLRDAIEKAGFEKPSQPTLSRILSRKTPNPGYKTINALIRQCGGDPESWMKESPEAQQSKQMSLDRFSSAELSAELTRRLSEPERMVVNAKKIKAAEIVRFPDRAVSWTCDQITEAICKSKTAYNLWHSRTDSEVERRLDLIGYPE